MVGSPQTRSANRKSAYLWTDLRSADPTIFICALWKKLTENSTSLFGCNRLTCKGDGKLFRHEDQVNPTSFVYEDGIFRNQRNFPTVNLTRLDDADGIFRNQRNFPTVFGSHAKEFSTIFRQLSDEWIKIKSGTIGTQTSVLQDYILLLYHCATLTLNKYTVTIGFLRQYFVYLRQNCVNLRQYCAFLRQCWVNLRQYSVEVLKLSMGLGTK